MAPPHPCGHPSDVAWPRRVLHGTSRGRVRMAPPRPFRHTHHTFRGPVGAPIEGHSGRIRMAPPQHFGTPLTRSVAP
eukprot:6177764-Pyramimonas_sp.AAC.1